MEGSTELRKLPPGVVYELVRILEIQEDWKKLMAIVPKNGSLSDCQFPKYKVEHMKLIEHAANSQKRACAEIFLEEWGTSGRKRPDLLFLATLLGKAELFRAADYVTDLMKVSRVQRPSVGPSAPVDVSEEAFKKLIVKLPVEKKMLDVRNNNRQIPLNTDELNRAIDEMSIPDGSLPSLDGSGRQTCVAAMPSNVSSREYSRTSQSKVLGEQETVPLDQLEGPGNSPLHLETSIPHMSYADLDLYTDHFNETAITAAGGRKLGSGAFGAVYLGVLPTQKLVAVKRLNRDAVNVEKQFRNEVESLSRFRHTNLLGLLGYSCDSDMYCLVYEYMSKGSLQSRLACKDEENILSWHVRVRIALGTACGIQYLHTAYEKPLIHRDIKSANILLDEHLVPKIGDFGLVRLGQQQGNTMTLTTTVLGTSAYMAPEAFRGDVSVKLDTFSFGVVLLEILTGLPPYDEEREGHDLVTHVEAMCEETGSIEVLLDQKAGDWGAAETETSGLAQRLYSVACSCIEDNRQKRPVISVVVKWLEDIVKLIT